jgi:hypothetical protein
VSGTRLDAATTIRGATYDFGKRKRYLRHLFEDARALERP